MNTSAPASKTRHHRPSVVGWRAALAATAGLLLMAPAALADATGYEVPAGPNYTVTKEGPGLVKVEYRACLDQENSLPVTITTSERRGGTAEVFMLQDDGVSPTFAPGAFGYSAGDTTENVRVVFSPTTAEERTFRFKARTDSGQGQAAGVRVTVTAVLCEAGGTLGPPGTPTNPGAGSDPNGSSANNPEGSSGQGGVLGVAAEGWVPSPRRLRLTAGRPTRLTVTAREGTTVRVRGPGVRLRRWVGTSGSVVLSVRPRGSGRVVVRASACFDLQRAAVLAERRARTRRSPRFTG